MESLLGNPYIALVRPLPLLSLELPEALSRSQTLHLNATLLDDPLCSQVIHKAITDFISIHENYSTPLPTQREALKAVLQGIFI